MEFAGAKVARLNFIKQQQQVALIAKFPQTDQIFSGGNGYSAFALDRFDQNRRRLRRHRAGHCLQIIEWNVFEAAHHRPKTLFYFFLTGRGDSGQGSSMKRAERRNNLVTASAMAKLPSQFEQAFVGFGTAVAKKTAAGADQV